jgi:hypothetical protein
LASPRHDDNDKDTSPPPPHFVVPVDLYKGWGDVRYYSYTALIDSGATYNFGS